MNEWQAQIQAGDRVFVTSCASAATVTGFGDSLAAGVRLRLDNGRAIATGWEDLAPLPITAPPAPPLDPVAALDQLGAKWSPAFSRPGPLTITSRDCVLCGPDRDCTCRPCQAPYRSYLATEDEPCGMTIGPDGTCPRGHDSRCAECKRLNCDCGDYCH